jgi:lysophospholipid acyltransferase (LPLAT)-like uncharacterized protein
MFKRLMKRPALQAALAHAIGLYLGFALRTTRWTLHVHPLALPHMSGRQVVAAFWHEHLPLAPMIWLTAYRGSKRTARMNVLVSRHRDGRFIAAVVRRYSVAVVHGSSSKGGAASVRHLLGLLGQGEYVGITPDGPRGPRRQAAPGVAQIAALSGVPVLPCAAQTTRGWVLNSWDRMVLPLPFGRGVIVCGAPIAVPRRGWEDSLPEIQAAMTAASAEADCLCGR